MLQMCGLYRYFLESIFEELLLLICMYNEKFRISCLQQKHYYTLEISARISIIRVHRKVKTL
jgi:hypothetical protein